MLLPHELRDCRREDEHVAGAVDDLVLRYDCECASILVYPYLAVCALRPGC